jgi:HEAT repeat protein
MLRLSRLEPLSPLGSEFASSVLQAARQQATDPQRLSQLVAQLNDDSQARYRAAEQLLRAGPHMVPPLLGSIAQGDSAELQRAATELLAGLGDAAVPPLGAYLSSSDARLQALAVRSLGHTRSGRATPYLVRPYFAADASEAELRAAVDLE